MNELDRLADAIEEVVQAVAETVRGWGLLGLIVRLLGGEVGAGRLGAAVWGGRR